MTTRLKLLVVAYVFIGLLALLGAAEERSALGASLIVVLGIFVGVFVLVELLRSRSRGRVMASEARRLGLAYAPKDAFGLLDMPFALIRRSRLTFREVDNVLWGRWRDLEVRVFDYAYQESEDEWRRFTCAMAIVGGWPALVIEPENLATSVAHLLGLHDIEFESERFNRAFEIRCEDRRFAYTFVDARLMEWLLGLSPRWGFELSGGWILGYREQPKPEEVESMLATLSSFLERIPPVVSSLYPPRSSPIPTRPDARPGSLA